MTEVATMLFVSGVASALAFVAFYGFELNGVKAPALSKALFLLAAVIPLIGVALQSL